MVGDHNFDILVEYLSYLTPGDPREFAEEVGQMVDSVLLQAGRGLRPLLAHASWEEIMSVGEKLVEQGRQEGQEQERRETAKRLLERGFSVNEVAELTNLSAAEVARIEEDRK